MLPVLLLIPLVPTTQAWATDVHNQIGFAAEQFLSPFTKDVLSRILDPQFEGSIGRAAAWADAYAHTVNGSYTYPWHWIDSEDNPPYTCNLLPTDCPSSTGCIISAITTQTPLLQTCISQALNSPLEPPFSSSLPCSHALNFILHFLSDIAQPLHASGHAAGGNFVHVSFAGRTVTLHSLWDAHLAHHFANVTAFPTTEIAPWFSQIVTRIRAEDFDEDVDEWVRCVDPRSAEKCAMEWARESNMLTCEYVYRGIFEGHDLLESGYVEGMREVVEVQVARAAVRLAAWLEALVVEAMGESVGKVEL